MPIVRAFCEYDRMQEVAGCSRLHAGGCSLHAGFMQASCNLHTIVCRRLQVAASCMQDVAGCMQAACSLHAACMQPACISSVALAYYVIVERPLMRYDHAVPPGGNDKLADCYQSHIFILGKNYHLKWRGNGLAVDSTSQNREGPGSSPRLGSRRSIVAHQLDQH